MQAFRFGYNPIQRKQGIRGLKTKNSFSHFIEHQSPFPSDSIQVTSPDTSIIELAESMLTEEPWIQGCRTAPVSTSVFLLWPPRCHLFSLSECYKHQTPRFSSTVLGLRCSDGLPRSPAL